MSESCQPYFAKRRFSFRTREKHSYQYVLLKLNLNDTERNKSERRKDGCIIVRDLFVP